MENLVDNRVGGWENLRNHFDLFLRRGLPWGHPVRSENATVRAELRLGDELETFIARFDWARWRRPFATTTRLRVADVGCRNFALGPAIERALRGAWELEVHGIEVDAYRRLRDLRTRRDYGRYLAARMKNGTYHAMDFHAWSRPLHIVFLLNPFVTAGPLSAWGLPRTFLRPEAMFRHARRCLEESRGILVLSHPTRREETLGDALARAAGFEIVEKRDWQPAENSLQRQPRYGTLCLAKAAEFSP